MVFYCSSAEGVGGPCAHQIGTIGIKIWSVTFGFQNLSLTIAIIKFKASYQFDLEWLETEHTR